MSANSKIEWTHHTFNPWWGCEKVSPACAFCYAERDSKRYGFDLWGADAGRRFFGDDHWRQPVRWNEAAAESGVRARVFCASMADVCEDRADLMGARDRLGRLIQRTRHLDWLLLTKRPENFERLFGPLWPFGIPDNVWVGTTVENQEQADNRIPHLLQIPATVRFLSCEPLLGPVDLTRVHWGWTYKSGRREKDYTSVFEDKLCFYDEGEIHHHPIDWVIAGGESGPHARPLHPVWVRALRYQCKAAGIPFFFKQWGEWAPISKDHTARRCAVDMRGRTTADMARSSFPTDANSFDGWQVMYRVGKKAAGRLIDGVEHNDYPVRVTVTRS